MTEVRPHQNSHLQLQPAAALGVQTAAVLLQLMMAMMLLQVQEAVKCRVVDRQEDTNGDSGGSFQNGHAQLMVGKHLLSSFICSC